MFALTVISSILITLRTVAEFDFFSVVITSASIPALSLEM
jgi:hypothetical protein